jgi:GNAT superfamily N-acetyltransferase
MGPHRWLHFLLGNNVFGVFFCPENIYSRIIIQIRENLAEHRNKGYASAAIKAAEDIHGANNWSLGTILQEPGNLHLYEKMGYHQNGVIVKINDKMDIVIYEKE